MRLAPRLGWTVNLLAVAAFAGLGWTDAFEAWWAKAMIVALFSVSITLLGASSNGLRGRLLVSLLGAVVTWVVLVLVASAMTLMRFGDFEEGGPVGLALVFGFYLGLPIAASTLVLTLLTWRVSGLSGERA